jgi:hypothetical protein
MAATMESKAVMPMIRKRERATLSLPFGAAAVFGKHSNYSWSTCQELIMVCWALTLTGPTRKVVYLAW